MRNLLYCKGCAFPCLNILEPPICDLLLTYPGLMVLKIRQVAGKLPDLDYSGQHRCEECRGNTAIHRLTGLSVE